MNNEQIMNLLDSTILTEENASNSKNIFLLRTSVICKYILLMTRAEAVAYIFKISGIIICEKTFDRYLAKALRIIGRKL